MAREQDEKVKVIETEELKIGDNSFCFQKSFVQLSNISQVQISPVPKLQYPLRYIVIFIGSLLVMFSGLKSCLGAVFVSSAEYYVAASGIIAAVISGILLYRIYDYNKKCGEYLVLNLNSGKNLYFEGNNPRFLNEIMKVIQNCIDDKNLYYIVNMNECQIETVQTGDHNTVNR